MKHLYILICLLSFSICSAQDPQLFENTWHLQNVIIDGQDNFPPSNDELSDVPAVFTQDGFFTSVCNELSGFIEYDNDTFNFPESLTTTLIFCQYQINQDFEGIYFNFYDSTLGNLYNYTITTDSNDNKTLIVLSNNGNQAIYGDHILSVEDFYNIKFVVYPNPTKTELFITSKNITGNLNIKIFNIEGKLLNVQSLDFEKQVSIDVSNLSSGIYFLNIEDESGNTAVKKFIKE